MDRQMHKLLTLVMHIIKIEASSICEVVGVSCVFFPLLFRLYQLSFVFFPFPIHISLLCCVSFSYIGIYVLETRSFFDNLQSPKFSLQPIKVTVAAAVAVAPPSFSISSTNKRSSPLWSIYGSTILDYHAFYRQQNLMSSCKSLSL